MESSERPDLVWEGRGMSVYLWLRNTNLSQEGIGVSSKGSEEGGGEGVGLDVGSAMLDVCQLLLHTCHICHIFTSVTVSHLSVITPHLSHLHICQLLLCLFRGIL